MVIFLIAGISLTFPEDSREWAHYLVPAVSGQVAYELSDYTMSKLMPKQDKYTREFWSIVVGTFTGFFTYNTFLRNHYKTDRELLLGANGTLHWAFLRSNFLFVKMILK